jgi:hypothetical protein
MNRENLTELEVSIFAIWAPSEQRLATDEARSVIDLDGSKSCVSQWNAFQQFRLSVLKTLRNLLERYPNQRGPTLFVKSHLGPKESPLDRFGITVEGRRGEKDRIIRWYCKETRTEVEERCTGSANIMRRLKAILTPRLEAWFAEVVLDAPEAYRPVFHTRSRIAKPAERSHGARHLPERRPTLN